MANKIYYRLVVLPWLLLVEKYLLGYNVPGYEYLWHEGSHFVLKMRVVDHIYDEQLVDHMTLQIVLPEGAQ